MNIQLKKFKTFPDNYFFFEDELKHITKDIEKENKIYAKAKETMIVMKDSDNRLYAFTSAPSKISMTCSRLLLEHPELDYVALWASYVQEDRKISLRSRTTEVNKIAERFGGGGHASASAFSLFDKPELFEDLKNGINIF